MIIDTFDNKSKAIISPAIKDKRVKCDVCLVTFSHIIVEHILQTHKCKKVGECVSVCGNIPFYTFKYKNKQIGFYKTSVGAPASVGIMEDMNASIDADKFIVFGSAGVLDNTKCSGKVIVPTFAYRDEGTSYHYAKAKDFIKINNSNTVAEVLKENNIPYVKGKVWTTDAFYRETVNNFNKRREAGCIAVDMECSALQALCDFRGKSLYYMLFGGDELDAPVWDGKKLDHANHNLINLEIALFLATKI